MEHGRAPLRGGAARGARDRLHDPVDDAVARRRVHAGAVHGRHPRAALPRVRRHHRHGDADLRLRLAVADADAVQPLPAAAGASRATAASTTASERFFDRLRDSYGRGLSWSLDHRRTTMAFLGLALALTGYLFVKVPKGFLPNEDTGSVSVFTQGAEGISPYAMMRHQQEAAAIVKAHPAVEQFMSFAGRGGNNAGTIFMRLKPLGTRPPAEQVVAELRKQLSVIPGLQVFIQIPPPIRLGGRFTQAQYQFTLQGPDTDELYRASAAMLGAHEGAARLPRRRHRPPAAQPAGRGIDRPRQGRRLRRLRAPGGGRPLLRLRQPPRLDHLRSQQRLRRDDGAARPSTSATPTRWRKLYVHAAAASSCRWRRSPASQRAVGPLAVAHSGQLPAVTLSFNLAPGTSIDEATRSVEAIAAEVLPATVNGNFQGTAQAFQSSMQGLGVLLLMSVAGHLHRARHALRELHPPADHPLGAAAGRLRRPRHPLHLPPGAVALRLRRRHHAGRAGEEERHHDGRLRRRAPPRRRRRPRRHLRGLRWCASGRS